MREIKPLVYSTEPLKAALVEYNRTAPERQQLWDTVESNGAVEAAERADKAALTRVQDAFYEVTKDRNSREHCRCVDIGFMRKIAYGDGAALRLAMAGGTDAGATSAPRRR